MTRRALWVTLVGVLALCALAGGLQAAGLLDGKTFAGETGEKGKTSGDKETFVFQDGRFDPLACHKYGFSGAPYTAKAEGDTVHFQSETHSEKEGTMRWKGTVRGNGIAGTVGWTKAGQAPIEYWFRGELGK